MHSEITTGENPVVTSFVGASAPPSQVAAAIAQKTPRPCIERVFVAVVVVIIARSLFQGLESCGSPGGTS
jgi:hypothetical protein